MLAFLFGKKKFKVKASRKPPAKMLKMCKKLKIKTMKKLGKKRVYKSQAVLRKLIKRKMRKVKKTVKRMRFGSMPAIFNNNSSDFGYNQSVNQVNGTVGQSPNFVTSTNNKDRPHNILSGGKPVDMRLEKKYIPTYGTSARFFNQSVPRVVSPQWYAMAQPDGSMMQVGAPFYGNTKSSSFGKKRRLVHRSKGISNSVCKGTRKSICGSNPNCSWRKRRGCVYRKGVKKGAIYEGPSRFGKARKARKVRKVRKVQKVKKLSRSIVKMCRRLKIKITVKRGSKRVPKKLSVLKKLIAKKLKKLKKRVSKKRRSARRSARR